MIAGSFLITVFVPLVCCCLQLQDVELPALLVIQHLGNGWRDVIQRDWDRQLALTHIYTHTHTNTQTFEGNLTIKGAQ